MAALDITFYVLSALAGLCIGSFLNVCIYRLPRGKFFSKARSFCPKCGEAIKAYGTCPIHRETFCRAWTQETLF